MKAAGDERARPSRKRAADVRDEPAPNRPLNQRSERFAEKDARNNLPRTRLTRGNPSRGGRGERKRRRKKPAPQGSRTEPVKLMKPLLPQDRKTQGETGRRTGACRCPEKDPSPGGAVPQENGREPGALPCRIAAARRIRAHVFLSKIKTRAHRGQGDGAGSLQAFSGGPWTRRSGRT